MFNILKSVSKKSSRCHEGKSGVALNYISVVLGDFLANTFNESVQTIIFSEFFGHRRSFLLFKKGAKDYCNNCRPISLLSSLTNCY